MYAVIEMMSRVPSVIPMIASVESFDLVLGVDRHSILIYRICSYATKQLFC